MFAKERKCWKLWLIRIGYFFGLLLMSPFVILFWFPLVLTYLFKLKFKVKMLGLPKWKRFLCYAGVCFLACILNPLVIPLSLIVLPFIWIYLICRYCNQRKKLRENNKKNLEKKLGLNMANV